MGEAKDLVGKPPKKEEKKIENPKEGTGVLRDLHSILDRLDRAKEVKLSDLDSEPSEIARNHVKLGILNGASALIRRAAVMLADYNG